MDVLVQGELSTENIDHIFILDVVHKVDHVIGKIKVVVHV